MDLHSLESQLTELAAHCDRLTEVLAAERRAMKAWQLDSIQALAEEKEVLLAVIRETDQVLQGQLETTCDQHACSLEQLIARPEAAGIRELRARIKAASQLIRQEAELNRQAADHAVRFLRGVRGDAAEQPPLTYSPGLAAYRGMRMQH